MLWNMDRIVTLQTVGFNKDGAASGAHEGKEIGVFGMLPGERAFVSVLRRKHIYQGTVVEMVESSPRRISPLELHHLSCSPWQIMEYALQLEAKQEHLAGLFKSFPDAPVPNVLPAREFTGYRTKIEFSFTDRECPLSLAFHERGGGTRRLPLPEGCVLASKEMNTVALLIVERLRRAGISSRSLKTLIIRESKSTDDRVAALYVKDEVFPEVRLDDIPGLSGGLLIYSTHKSPASVVTKELARWGNVEIRETIGGFHFSYAWDAFFQNNVPMFTEALGRMSTGIPSGARVVELYSGVGTIGLSLAKSAGEVVGVEIIPSAVENAAANARENGITNYRSMLTPAEKIDPAVLDGADVLVLDPPRSGLHPKVIAMIREKKPPMISYLSCNPETQARDYGLLVDMYEITVLEGFDFYPQTPHAESLAVLKLRA
jgi:23S rRNA (uracil1939-C5)-methyltransferase